MTVFPQEEKAKILSNLEHHAEKTEANSYVKD